MTPEPDPAVGPDRPADPADLRISDTDRAAALEALGEHMAAGRLDLDEYGTRTAQVTTARTVRELQGLFTDLPHPHPPVSAALVPQQQRRVAATPAAAPVVASRGRRVLAAVAASSGILAVIAFFILDQAGVDNAWLVFLLIPLVWAIAGRQARGDRHRDRGNRR